ncbi:MAG: hypothetical protein KJ063_06445 [Anaerolineae bacterium]|nr:hypothetical protein [Anaerolineae bacterium]
MNDNDNPLKILITEFADAFAAWLLERPIQSVRPLNVEFPAQPIRSDLLFEVYDTYGGKLLLHFELQGRSSHKPMPYRELNYLCHTVTREIPLPLGLNSPRLHSVVLYVGEGAGRGDNGSYTINGPGDELALHWQYQPIRLWEIPAENLLQLGQPALAALIGLTRLQQPEQVIPLALAHIRTIPDEKQRQQLLTAMVTLLPTEEVTQMVEKLLEENETLLIDTPYLRRMRQLGQQEGRQEGVQIGRQEGVQIGRQEGVQIGRQEGVQIGRQEGVQIGHQQGQEQGLRDAILEAVVHKFNPSAAAYRQLQHNLEQIHQPSTLQRLLLMLFDNQDVTPILNMAQEMADETR